MRIRKQASKLLGWAYCSTFPSSSSPPLSMPSECTEADIGEQHCQLNLSPWDAIESPHCTNFQKELNEEQMKVNEKTFNAKVDEEEEEDEEVEEDARNVKGQVKKRREREMEVFELGTINYCKKTDGKGWHCKRASQTPHSLCSYHLAQLRSYRARCDDQVSTSRGRAAHYHRKRSEAENKSNSGYYYYYSILGPWWGKRRGKVDDEEELAPDDDDDDDSDTDGDNMPLMRTGRKPVKARSLKSLL